MTKVLRQLTVTEKFIEDDPLSVTKKLLSNNKDYQDLVFTTSNIQSKGKAYYVKIRLPYNDYIPTAFLFKLRKSNEEIDNTTEILDFENDTYQAIKYAEAPYTKGASQLVDIVTVGYTVDNIRRYHCYTYNQFLNEADVSLPEEDFKDIHNTSSPGRTAITNYILQNFDMTATNFKFDLQKVNISMVEGSEKYIIFDFIFISKIPWNQFICCYDRNSYDQYSFGGNGRVLDPNSTEIYAEIYPFKNNSDLIERPETYGTNRIYHSLNGEVNKLILKVYDGTNALDNIPFYINSQSLKIGSSKQYILDSIPIYNFGIPNEDNYTCIIEYEYDNE